jgi:hypothetical protein
VTSAAIRRWRWRFGFPLLPGRWKRTPPLSSSYLILAWLVNLLRSGEADGVAISKGRAAAIRAAEQPLEDCDSPPSDAGVRA